MAAAVRVRLEAVECYERDVALRLPFRFGVITVTRATQAVLSATIALEDGSRATGVAAENLAAKWFDKDPHLSDAQNLDQLRQSLQVAIDLYRGQGLATPFRLFAASYGAQLARGRELELVPLVACYGPALLDRAILDAVGRARAMSFAELINGNVPGIEATLTPDLADFDVAAFLASLKPRQRIAVRHTVGLLDPIVAGDQRPQDRINDGLPETLEEVVATYATQYYKLKVSGDVAADIDRLTRIAAVLDRGSRGYWATLDGNEQYEELAGIAELWRRIRENKALHRLAAAVLFIEQPIARASALTTPIGPPAELRPLIIDESDGELSSFPTAVGLGYSGVSSKNCKGLYKSLLNAARVAKLNRAAGKRAYFMSGEDLTTLAGVSVQQDLALVGLLGLSHVERNGHHFIDGMSFAPEREQASFLAAHPDLYRRHGGSTRLRIQGGELALGSLACAGFAAAGQMDFTAMRSMRVVPMQPLAAERKA